MDRDDLGGPGLCLNSTRPVVTDAVDCCVGIVDDCVVVNIVHNRRVHVVDRPVVIEAIAIPIAALIAVTRIAVPVVDASVIADVTTPVAPVVRVAPPAVVVVPEAGGPQRPLKRRRYPRPWHPVIAI